MNTINYNPQKSKPVALNGRHILTNGALDHYFKQLHTGWRLQGEHRLEREYLFKSYRDALNFAYKAGELAEELEHYPELTLNWGKVLVTIHTAGLTEMDFLLGTQMDKLFYSSVPH